MNPQFAYRTGFALTALALAVTSSFAATSGPAGLPFYAAPSAVSSPAAHGTLTRYRTATVNLGAGAPTVKAWNVMYQSQDSVGAGNYVTGTVIVPTAAWSGSGSRPIISYAVGTHGLAQGCAPSLQFAGGTDYENANIVALLKAGYAVAVTDNAGYTTGDTPTYLAGASQGHAALDILKAVTQIPFAGFSSSAKTAVWGFSQGGQTAAWAGEQAATYVPGNTLVGIAAGGTPANFKASAHYLDGGPGSFFLLGGVVGLAEQYPAGIPLNTLANAEGQAAIVKGKTECVFQALFDPTFYNRHLSDFVVNNPSLDELLSIPSVSDVLDAQNLGKTKPSVPLYAYHGQADEFIPLDQHIALKKAYCSKFSTVYFDLYPGEHIMTQFQAAPTVVSWLGDRVAGKSAPSNCVEFAPQPPSTANPNGGDFIVSLKDWTLSGTVSVKNLGASLTLPATSRFNGNSNLTANKQDGTLTVPQWVSNINILGLIPAALTTSLTQVAPLSGSASLDGQGNLHVHGYVDVNISVDKLVAAGFLPIPAGCSTTTPARFPIDFDGPVSSLGNGNLTFAGTVTFPPLGNCGSQSGLLNSFFAGPGSKFSFTIKPPAPKGW